MWVREKATQLISKVWNFVSGIYCEYCARKFETLMLAVSATLPRADMPSDIKGRRSPVCSTFEMHSFAERNWNLFPPCKVLLRHLFVHFFLFPGKYLCSWLSLSPSLFSDISSFSFISFLLNWIRSEKEERALFAPLFFSFSGKGVALHVAGLIDSLSDPGDLGKTRSRYICVINSTISV